MITRIIILITLIIFTQSAAQIKLGSDKKISTDNNPSTIIQNNPKIFCNDTLEFITTWHDYRNGERNIYAQKFDSQGNKTGGNFQIDSDLDIRYLPDGSFINFSEKYHQYIYWDEYEVLGRIHSKDGTLSDQFKVSTTHLGCDVCCTGIDFDMITKNDTILFFFRNEGYLYLRLIDLQGNVKYLEDTTDVLPDAASIISTAVNSNNNYVLTWYGRAATGYNYPDEDLPIGIYANFYTSNDSAFIRRKLIKNIKNDDPFGCIDERVLLKTVCITDTLFGIYWLDKDSLTFNYQLFTDKGDATGSIKTIQLNIEKPSGINWFRETYPLSISPVKDGSFAIFVSGYDRHYSPDEYKYFSSVLYFNVKGQFINKIESNSKLPEPGRETFKTGANTFITVDSDKKDAYLKKLTDITTTDSSKINDDTEGSNEINALLRRVNDQTNILTWSNEKDFAAQKVSTAGSLVGSPVRIKGTDLILSNTGKALNIWKIDANPYLAYVSITIYDMNWNILSEDTLMTNDDYFDLDGSVIQFSDSVYIMFINSDDKLVLRTMDPDFEVLKEKLLSEDFYDVKLFKEDKNSFWVSSINSVQLFSTELEPLGPKYTPFYTHLYLNNNKFLYTEFQGRNNWRYYNLYGNIFTTGGDTLVRKFYIGSMGYNDVSLYLLPNNDFLTVYRQDDNIFARAFSQEGKAKTDSFMIHDNVDSYKRNASALFNEGKIYFTWSDARNAGKGYDIYMSIFDYGSVVRTEPGQTVYSYKLDQNFPNPFNPLTVIRYSIPEQQNVEVIIYDILGKRIATLVNEVKAPGEYEVEFNSPTLSSGIYIYSLRAGTFRETRKMLLIR